MTIYIVPIEPIDTRYTRQWYEHIPKRLDAVGEDVIIIEGDDVPPKPSPGAFLDFGATNIYKGSQLHVIAELFRNGSIKPGSKFLYTDAWNPTVLQLKYMSSLLNIPVEIHGMWHAGSYDWNDFLGRLVGNKPWVRYAEQSMFYCYDYNWFATRYHIGIFASEILDVRNVFSRDVAEAAMHWHKNIKLTGWPMEYLYDLLEPYSKIPKKKQIVFPHRLAPEKQVDIFKDLANSMPEYEWVICQEKTLTKDEYHTILGESAIVFSANLQETYGISTCAEGPLCNAIPIAPDRLSYTEIFKGYDDFLYPTGWTLNYDKYLQNKSNLINKIKYTIDNQLHIRLKLHDFIDKRLELYLTAKPLIKCLTQ